MPEKELYGVCESTNGVHSKVRGQPLKDELVRGGVASKWDMEKTLLS